MPKPDCYQCRHRLDLAGDCHSSCGFLAAQDVRGALLIRVSVAAAATMIERNIVKIDGLITVRGNRHGCTRGWCSWPLNFDPIWIEECSGFRPKDAERPTQPAT